MKHAIILLLAFALLFGCSDGGGTKTVTKEVPQDDDTAGDDDNNDDTADDDTTVDDDSMDDDTDVPTECLIEGEVYCDGDTNPLNPCLFCDPLQNENGWSMNDGAACDDGVHCNGADVCLGGMCSVHNGDPCPDNHLFCDGAESCDEVNDTCTEPYDPCSAEETCKEEIDFCEPNAGTCYGAAWSTHDECGWDKWWSLDVHYTRPQIESWCNTVEDEYGKMTGLFFTCMDNCARNDECSTTCFDSCMHQDDPGGTGCEHVSYVIYEECGSYWELPGAYPTPLSDAYQLCGDWSNDWACYYDCTAWYPGDCGQMFNCFENECGA